MKAKITFADGRYTLIVPRNESNFTKTAFVSSTEAQPFTAGNFDAAGNEIGGRTMTQMAVDQLLAAAAAKGCSIDRG